MSIKDELFYSPKNAYDRMSEAELAECHAYAEDYKKYLTAAKTERLAVTEAIKLADEMELDLIEISPKADPPVCRIADYQKFLYQQKRKAKEIKAKQVKVVIKEIRFGPQTDDHDYNFKLKHAENFLKEGAKVKAYVFFRGRSIVFKEQGEILLLRFANDLEAYGKVESMPVLEGKRMIVMIAPLSKKNGEAQKAQQKKAEAESEKQA